MSFIHGVEIVEVLTGTQPIQTVKTGVIGLIGIAPKGPKNALTVISSAKQAAEKFGSPLTGFTIPQALDAIFKQRSGPVVVINVYDPATMVTAVSAEVVTVANAKFKLGFAPIGGTVTLTNSGGTTTYVQGTDFKVDDYGNVQILATITEGQSLRATYNKLNAAAITASVINGAITDGVYTGMKLLQTSLSTLSYVPKILVCPTYCELSSVATELIAQATSLESVAFIDAPSGNPNPSEVIAERGLAGTYAGFRTSSKFVNLVYPYVKRYDVATDSTIAAPSSPYWAGVMSGSDNSRGFWFSPSNVEIQGIVGIEFNLSANISDPNSDINLLNGAGINTLFTAFGAGIRTWGNRNASYPTNTVPDNFTSVQRVKTILNDSVKAAMLRFIALPISKALIDSIKETVNTYIRSLIQRGALIDGQCLYDPNDNIGTAANGQLVFQINFIGGIPAERITFNSFLDVSLLKSLNQ